MQTLVETLRTKLLKVATDGEPCIEQLTTRPIFFLATSSDYGKLYAQKIAPHLQNIIAVVDDFSSQKMLHGAPRWNSVQFLAQAKQYPDAVAIDFSCGPNARGWVSRLCDAAGVEKRDYMQARAQLGMPAVYESAIEHREKTLANLDTFLHLADRMDDDFSKVTLYANLLFRLTYERDHLMQAWSNPSEEYFSVFPETGTFRVGQNEHYCDCGAYQGPIVKKFLGASGYRYQSITAFEPDKSNFATLAQIAQPLLPNTRFINKGISNRQETLRFNALGNMSSRVEENGSVSIETTRLDDELEEITFLKMDVEGFESKVVEGGASLLQRKRPRMAIAAYHYATDLLEIMAGLDRIVGDYHFRLRQHNPNNFTDLVLYASPVSGVHPPAWAK
ncbi:FkbM family methyltransferase [uncultured Oxalicibacterium sp.]|uniref:FkbM family methyltransferase n=1 Tax=uncultured Oxalicibacterium sp. TaxID=1168540 RepID=UPI0025EB74DF|nr:FkbM family methyltransferase [uncultured Oxalicibacterium sp.]